MLANLLNLRKVAILAGVMVFSWGGHVWIKSIQVSYHKNKAQDYKDERDSWKFKYEQEYDKHMDTVQANESNQITLAKQDQALQQCVLNREANQIKAAQERTRHQGRIAEIQSKYDELRKIKVVSDCANVRIDPAVIQLLKD